MFRQWLCHPLADANKINARLDAVEAINSGGGFQEAFIMHLSKTPDLERLISRIHAGSTKAQDFLRVIEGFEQIRDAMEEITLYNQGEGLIGQLLAAMPDLKECLKQWESAFDREKAKCQGTLWVPKLWFLLIR
jgi:DNA mismatch repair protein MSH6